MYVAEKYVCVRFGRVQANAGRRFWRYEESSWVAGAAFNRDNADPFLRNLAGLLSQCSWESGTIRDPTKHGVRVIDKVYEICCCLQRYTVGMDI